MAGGSSWALFFGQLTGQHSLRDLITTLDAGRKKLQQVGLGAVSRSTLADANRKRPQEIFGELFGCLYQRCRRQAPGQRFGFRHRVYSLDATVIDLCLKVFDWAKFRKRKGGHPVNGEVGTWLAPSGSQICSPFACPYSRLQ